MSGISIPESFKANYSSTADLDLRIKTLCSTVEKFISINPERQPFFKDYTDHGIDHINKVLLNAESLISPNTLKILDPYELFYLVCAIIIHDIGLHISPNVFNSLINGSNDSLSDENRILDNHVGWKKLYEDHLSKLTQLTPEEKDEIYGNKDVVIEPPNVFKNWRPLPDDYLTVGLFIRKHHHRYSHEVARIGFFNPTSDTYNPLFDNNTVRREELQIIGAIARSHNTGLNDLDEYLKINLGNSERPIYRVQIKYLMAVLRLADYMEIDCERCGLNPYRYIVSKRSLLEHIKHDLVNGLQKDRTNKKLSIFISKVDNNELRDQIYYEIKKMVNGFQKELNDSHHAVSAINFSLEETAYKLNFDEVHCNIISYDDADIGSRKIKPYKYKGYLIEEYLREALKKYKDVAFNFKDDAYENEDADISDIFYPLSFKQIKGSYNKPATVVNDSSVQNVNDSMGEFDIPNSKFNYILNEKHKGVGFISDPGYGKTILSKALFCFFSYRALHWEKKELFWKELYELANLEFIPLLFVCHPSNTTKSFTTVEQFFNEALRQIGIIESHHLHKNMLDELMFLFNQKRTKLLIIIDALDELIDNKNEPIIQKFMDFLNNNIVNTERHSVIFTKRDGFATKLKEETIRYEIEKLNSEQQKEIISNLCHLKAIDERKKGAILELFSNDDKVSRQLKSSPLTLTNSFFYFDKNQIIPDLATLEKEMIQIFFLRKGKTCTQELYKLLLEIAVKIRELNNEKTIDETVLLNVIEDYIRKNDLKEKYPNAALVVYELSQQVGILTKDVSSKYTRYYFGQFKHLENLLGNHDAKEYQTIEKIEEAVLDRINQGDGTLDENNKNFIADMLKYYDHYNNKNPWINE